MGVLVDTSIWIAIERGALSAADLYAITRQEPVYVSPVNLAEIRYGIERMANASNKMRAMTSYRTMLRHPLLRITGDTGEIFGVLAARLRKAGRGADFRVQDLWLAAQAVQRGFSLLTLNVRDFKDIPDLSLVAVRLPRQ